MGPAERQDRDCLQPAGPGIAVGEVPGGGAEELQACEAELQHRGTVALCAAHRGAGGYRRAVPCNGCAGSPCVADPETERGCDPRGIERAAAGGERGGKRDRTFRPRRVAPGRTQRMKLGAVEMRRIRLSLVAPFETSFGVQTER